MSSTGYGFGGFGLSGDAGGGEPDPHAETHEDGGVDEVTLDPSQVTGTAVVDSDSRLTDARTPTSHAATHASAGADPVTIAQSQVTNLSTDLAGKIPLSAVLAAGDVIVGTGSGAVTRLADSASTILGTKATGATARLSAAEAGTVLGLGTAAVKNVPATGDAASTEVVLGSDTRLSGGSAADSDQSILANQILGG